jgi:hypothetical protein
MFSSRRRRLFFELERLMSAFFNLAEAAVRFGVAAAAERAAEHEALEAACVTIETKAKNYIGAPHSWWPPLAAETLKAKDNVNSPLLESGAMRDSIEHVVHGQSGFVGSNDDRAVWQEMGTSRGVPPRSFLGHAAQESGAEIAKMTAKIIGTAIGAALSGSRVSEIIEMARFVGHVAHEVKETASDMLYSDEDQKR